MMKSMFSSRRHKNPHKNEMIEKNDGTFFAKESKTPFFNSTNNVGIQPKLTVGQPNDKYEKEADNMADVVVSNSSKPDIQNKEISSIQRESLATPLEDEKLGTAEQRMEEDKLVQEKPESETVEEPEEEMASKMDEEKEEEGGEAVQTKSNTSSNTASSGLTQQIKNKTGKGEKLSKNTKGEMESSFRKDFSDVNIHTDKDAVNMNRELKAQAFTHGKDIYFNSGKYNPDTTEGKRLLTHELTHVVQQNPGKKIQKQSGNRSGRRRSRLRARQRVYIVRDRNIGIGGGRLVRDLRVFKRVVMRTRNEGEWTLVLSIHGSQDRLAAQSPPNWQRNAIFYNADSINALFSSDANWEEWRNRYGPTRLSLVSCQVSASFERVLINNLTRQIEGTSPQTPQGLGEGCKPLTRTANLTLHARSMRAYNRMSNEDQNRFLNQLRALNRRWGYYGASPVPEDQILHYFFNEVPRARWVIVEVEHHGRSTGIPFWNRSSGPESSRFRRLCDQGVGRMRRHRVTVPRINSD